jgi:hypothetical protein
MPTLTFVLPKTSELLCVTLALAPMAVALVSAAEPPALVGQGLLLLSLAADHNLLDTLALFS